MFEVRKGTERGHFKHGWLDTYHTFAFGDYHDPRHVSFRALRVMNEDRVQPGQGFGMHPHRDMEIVTYVLSGALQHQDSMGNGEVLRPGEFQRMSAGTGIYHSEFNPSRAEPVHLYQIWLLPRRKGIQPSYEQRAFSENEMRGRLRVVASPDGREGSLTINQDASIFLSTLGTQQRVTHELGGGGHAWLQVLRGAVDLNGDALVAGDGVAVSDETSVTVSATDPSELMLFDLN
jgi:redox-sensitive bicupin YhaK (pirin superfamily)